MSQRIQQINKLINRSVNEIITRELNLKSGVFVTLTKVDTSSDLKYSTVFVSIFPTSETNYVAETLKKEIYKIQGSLNKKLGLKFFPKIKFKVDTTESRADEIEKLLKKI